MIYIQANQNSLGEETHRRKNQSQRENIKKPHKLMNSTHKLKDSKDTSSENTFRSMDL